MSPRIGKFFLIWILPCLIFGSVWFYNHFLSVMTGLPCPASEGEFGDQFGALAALFSGLAFWGVIVSLLLQRDDLNMQRKELELQRQEMEDTRKEFAKQTELMRRQLESDKHEHDIRGIYQRLDRLRTTSDYLRRGNSSGYNALQEAITIIFKNFNILFLTEKKNTSILSSVIIKEIGSVSQIIEDIFVWLNVLDSNIAYIYETFSTEPKVVEKYVKLMFDEIPISGKKFIRIFQGGRRVWNMIEKVYDEGLIVEDNSDKEMLENIKYREWVRKLILSPIEDKGRLRQEIIDGANEIRGERAKPAISTFLQGNGKEVVHIG